MFWSALRALRASGPLLGKRVLITGASGGVGRYAVQLAHQSGAYVIAVVGSEARGRGLKERCAAADEGCAPVTAFVGACGSQGMCGYAGSGRKVNSFSGQ
jgi:NADPH2:quinone reductase